MHLYTALGELDFRWYTSACTLMMQKTLKNTSHKNKTNASSKDQPRVFTQGTAIQIQIMGVIWEDLAFCGRL